MNRCRNEGSSNGNHSIHSFKACWLITLVLIANASIGDMVWIETSSPRICLSITLCSFRNLDLHSLTWNKREQTHTRMLSSWYSRVLASKEGISFQRGTHSSAISFKKQSAESLCTFLSSIAAFRTHSYESCFEYFEIHNYSVKHHNFCPLLHRSWPSVNFYLHQYQSRRLYTLTCSLGSGFFPNSGIADCTISGLSSGDLS